MVTPANPAPTALTPDDTAPSLSALASADAPHRAAFSADGARGRGEREAEIEERSYQQARGQRRTLLPRALVVGLFAGAVAFVFRAALEGGDALRSWLYAASRNLPAGILIPMALAAMAAGVAVWLVRRFCPEAAGSGIPHFEAVLRGFRTLNGQRVLPVKFVGGILAMGAGLVMGREGPTVQMGAALADILCKRWKIAARERLTLMTAGAGAGLAAAFNAPLSGVIFVTEEIQRDFRPTIFGAAFVAAAVADVVARWAGGQQSVFFAPHYPLQPLTALPFFAILGAIAGLLGVCFNRSLLAALAGVERIPARYRVAFAAVVAAGIAGIGWFNPDALGGGHHLTERTMAGGIALSLVPLWFLARFGLTLLSYCTGAPGGVFAPLLGLGALIGLCMGGVAHTLFPLYAPNAAAFAAVGMAAYFAAIVRAPLTGITLVVEMTGDYNQMLPLLIACFAAYAVAEGLNERPLYESLLERDLERGAALSPAPGAPATPTL